MTRLSSKKLLFLAGELENGELAANQMGLTDAAKLMQAAKAIIVEQLTALEARRVQRPAPPQSALPKSALPKAVIIPFPKRRAAAARQRQLRLQQQVSG